LGAADAASQHKFACGIHAVQLKHILRKVDGKEPNDFHDDTPMNGNVSTYDMPAGAVHTINWRSRYGGMDVSEARRLRQLEEENQRLKRLVADQALDIQVLKDVLGKK
jgi:putative transposase